MKSNTRLELPWIGKENRPSLVSRPAHWASENDLFDNRLIFGDNLLALKTLKQEFTGKIKCIYIDPPTNRDGSGISDHPAATNISLRPAFALSSPPCHHQTPRQHPNILLELKIHAVVTD